MEDLRLLYGDMIGLTGIIGSGKSTAARMFGQRGFFIIDADKLARFVYTADYPYSALIKKEIFEKIDPLAQKKFHRSILDFDNNINRVYLAQLVFDDEQARLSLNNIVHPHVQKLVKLEKAKSGDQPVIYDVPLLFENHLQNYLKKTIVVYCPQDIALMRAVQRTGLAVEEIKKRIETQISIEKKRNLADYVLYNDTSLENLEEQIDSLVPLLQI